MFLCAVTLTSYLKHAIPYLQSKCLSMHLLSSSDSTMCSSLECMSAVRGVSSVCKQVRGSWPPFITVGKPFKLQLTASNATQHVLDLSLRLGDTTGYMLAGAPRPSPALEITGLTAWCQDVCYCLHIQHGATALAWQGMDGALAASGLALAARPSSAMVLAFCSTSAYCHPCVWLLHGSLMWPDVPRQCLAHLDWGSLTPQSAFVCRDQVRHEGGAAAQRGNGVLRAGGPHRRHPQPAGGHCQSCSARCAAAAACRAQGIRRAGA